MRHAPICPRLDGASIDLDSSFNVLIAYEDFETGKHAKKTYDFVVQNLGPDCRFTNQMWKFDVLTLPKLCDIAVEDATAADIIMISSNGGELPEGVKAWIEAWLPFEPGPLALVALSPRADQEDHRADSAQHYLARIARRGNMEFFAQPEVWPGRQIAQERFPLARLGQKTLCDLAGFAQRDVSLPRFNLDQ